MNADLLQIIEALKKRIDKLEGENSQLRKELKELQDTNLDRDFRYT